MRAVFAVVAAVIRYSHFVGAQSTLGTTDHNTDPDDPEVLRFTTCGDIVDASNNVTDPYDWFYASDALDCLTSVPFNAAVATRFVTYFNQTLQFQSTSAWLRNPPLSYQQPASDTFSLLRQIQTRIDQGYYRNHYAFDVDVQTLIQGAHDTHVGLYAGALSQFTFAAPFYLVSVSEDGKKLPEVYDWDDLARQPPLGFEASPLKLINDVPVVDWLKQFAKQQSVGMVEPDADWNQLMNSPAQTLVGGANVLSGGATFYPGDDLNVTYQNGTSLTTYWLALYNSPGFTGPLQTGGDFYNFFVLGLEPANWEEAYDAYEAELSAQQTSTPQDNATTPYDDSGPITSWHSLASAYPNDTMMHQHQLGLDTSGYVTGYYLDDISTAVLSIPTFDEFGDGIDSFSTAIGDFITNATAKNASKVIIDLQQNAGGLEALAINVYEYFFTAQDKPVLTSRMRSHGFGDQLGSSITRYFQTLDPSDEAYDDIAAEEWVVTDRINNATGQNFTSWAQFYGPLTYNQDNFSLIAQYNLSSQVFLGAALGVEYSDPCQYNNTCQKSENPWAPSEIVILTDGTCGSTCALLVELMTQQVSGVRTVVIGGRPQTGPMQAASGSRGARAYSGDEVDSDFFLAQDSADLDPNTDGYVADTGMLVNYAGINLRDQIRAQQDGAPNQFLYMPADCRIYWTLANFNDYDRLWHDVYNAIYNDTSLCVPGSTNAKALAPPTPQKRSDDMSENSVSTYIEEGLLTGNTNIETAEPHLGSQDGKAQAPKSITFCSDKNGKPDTSMCKLEGYTCKPFSSTCAPCKGRSCPPGSGSGSVSKNVCVPVCKKLNGAAGSDRCTAYQQCVPDSNLNSKANSNAVFGKKSKGVSGFKIQSGRCFPFVQPSTSCGLLVDDKSYEQQVSGKKAKRNFV